MSKLQHEDSNIAADKLPGHKGCKKLQGRIMCFPLETKNNTGNSSVR